MTQISGADLQAALDFVGEAHSFEDVESFRTGILPGLKRLIPCDLVGYNEVYSVTEPALVVTHPEPMLTFAGEALARYAHQHPLISVQMNGDNSTYKISDFLTQREFHSLELYNDLYRRIGAEDQIACGLPGPMVIGIAMNRDRRAFTERDRVMLDLLRPHLAQAHQRLLERSRTTTLLAALERSLAEQGGAVVLVGGDGTISQATAAATALLRDYFPPASEGRVPTELAEWLGGSLSGPAGRTPLVIDTRLGRLTVRDLGAEQGGETMLVLGESRAVTPDVLASLPLTRRQAEILALLASGKSVESIAEALFISPRTARKHVENIYRRLGVHNRAAAVSAARKAASRGRA